jgi:hypothetical protein
MTQMSQIGAEQSSHEMPGFYLRNLRHLRTALLFPSYRCLSRNTLASSSIPIPRSRNSTSR